MIKLNEEVIDLNHFPDGTFSFRVRTTTSSDPPIQWIRWNYEDTNGNEECMALWYLVHHIRSHAPNVKINLYLPYIPNARMDRVKSGDEVFTLKWFAVFINQLNFNKVNVVDPHSNVAVGLIDRVVVIDSRAYVYMALNHIKDADGLIFCYPDEGSAKRNADLYQREYVFGIKHRDWRTGTIESLEIAGAEKVKGKDVLIIDDICSRGGTFTHTAKALKAAGAENIYLYISHCENTIFDGTVLTDGLIEHVFTTDSIFRGEHDKITVI